jgi:prepilin-type N-terminal cleavage/methylation domain-containing protein
MKNSKGFNIVELLVVIAIMGLLAAMAVPGLTNLARKNRIENFTRRIYSDLMNTRVMAMDRNMMHFVSFGADQYIVYADTDESQTLDTSADTQVLSRSGPDLKPFAFSSSVAERETIMQNLGGTVEFNARGFAKGSGSASGAICVGHTAVNVRSSVNCIVVNTTRIRMGRIDYNETCSVDNCDEIQ